MNNSERITWLAIIISGHRIHRVTRKTTSVRKNNIFSVFKHPFYNENKTKKHRETCKQQFITYNNYSTFDTWSAVDISICIGAATLSPNLAVELQRCPKNLVRSVPKTLHVTLATDRTFFSLQKLYLRNIIQVNAHGGRR